MAEKQLIEIVFIVVMMLFGFFPISDFLSTLPEGYFYTALTFLFPLIWFGSLIIYLVLTFRTLLKNGRL